MKKGLLLSLCMIYFGSIAQQYDPMMPAYFMKKPVAKESAKVKQKTYYQVNQIFLGEHDRRAIVNGEIVRKGDWIRSARVVAIEKDKVLLKQSGKILTLHIEDKIPRVRTN
ncbi:MAG: hypothetical protein HWE39_02885 [Oceanospirillaceae bacterium]|nr:hypothetical protein [Oceanospirillaceae bacterium]